MRHLWVFGVSFSIIAPLPSIAYGSSLLPLANVYCPVLVYALPNGGASAMVWGVCVGCLLESADIEVKLFQWLVASLFILCIGLAMAEFGFSAPTSVALLLDARSPHLIGETCSAGSLGVRFSLLLALPA